MQEERHPVSAVLEVFIFLLAKVVAKTSNDYIAIILLFVAVFVQFVSLT